jgi:glutamate-1-semialdehyde 2,1-aminomutase
MAWPWESQLAASAPLSERIYREARATLAGGMSHTNRAMVPFPIAITRSSGARKWEIDGNEYVDYVMGHGALLLGHAHPDVVGAVQEQVAKGTHHGAGHRSEVEWAELVCSSVQLVVTYSALS